jgi:multisubunit Na+/H+ antiporter MnhF subunit
MKYSNTARVLSFLFHLILVLAFGVLGVYFGFFVVPFLFAEGIRDNFINNAIRGFAPTLDIELAVVGLSIFIISLYGLIQAGKGLANPKDDKVMVKSFTAFIGDGYIASAFFAACAFLYFDPIANGKLAFAIVMCVLLMIILLIATNIPMYRLFEGKETTEQLVGLSLTAAIGLGLVAIMNFAALICCMIVTKNTTMTYGDNISIQLAVAAVTNLIACGFMIASGAVIGKKGSADKKAVALGGYFSSGAFFFVGGALLSAGTMDLVWHADKYLLHLDSADRTFTGWGYGVMNVVIGGLAIIGAVVFAIVTYNESKKTAVKA